MFICLSPDTLAGTSELPVDVTQLVVPEIKLVVQQESVASLKLSRYGRIVIDGHNVAIFPIEE
ncbi:hypothetical protein D9M72_597030 [compost metagenome]